MNKPPNILLVQLFSNGDCLYATAIARQIKSDFPNCKLTWAIADFCKNIISNNPYVDEILVTDEVAKNDVAAFRRYKRKVFEEQVAGLWDQVFVTTNMDVNLALYDGTIRGMVLRAYKGQTTVPLQPVVELTEQEKRNVLNFATRYNLQKFKHVFLWEYAPQSGQSELNFKMVMAVAKRITTYSSTCIILSSANKFEGTEQIIDVSTLTVRENAALTHYCTLLIGCSSGITWLTTSTAAKFLPMLQLLNANTIFVNTPSVDFNRYNIAHNGLIEMYRFSEAAIYECLNTIVETDFNAAQKYHQQLPLQFKTTKIIVYNLLVYGEFRAIAKHFRVMKSVYGLKPAFLFAFAEGLITAPFKLVLNLFKKKILYKKK